MEKAGTLVLPRLVWQQTLAERLLEAKLDLRSISRKMLDGGDLTSVVVDWNEVRFFDDMALLKLLMMESCLRHAGVAMRHVGLSGDWRRAGLARQLWASGYLELISSCQLWGPEQARLGDVADLLELQVDEGADVPKVMRIIACHRRQHFERGSRAIKRIREFTELRRYAAYVEAHEAQPSTWEMIANGEFRGLLLEQARWNVKEHANAGLGLAMARIVDPALFKAEWSSGLRAKDDILSEVLDCRDPFAEMLRESIERKEAFLAISTIDDGVGFRKRLARLMRKRVQGEDLVSASLFESDPFRSRFSAVADWPSVAAKCLAFATDPIGSSKTYRPPGPKGLTNMVDAFVLGKGGRLWLSSDGWAVDIDGRLAPPSVSAENRFYGKAERDSMAWTPEGKRGSALVLMTSLGEVVQRPPDARHGIVAGSLRPPDTDAAYVPVALTWNEASKGKAPTDQTIGACAHQLVAACTRPDNSPDAPGLVVLDWSEMPAKKDVLRGIVAHFVDGLSDLPTDRLLPFVFAQLSDDILPLLHHELRHPSHTRASPICAFSANSSRPHWIGINCEAQLSTQPARIPAVGSRRPLAVSANTYAQYAMTQALSHDDYRPLPTHIHRTPVPASWQFMVRGFLAHSPLIAERLGIVPDGTEAPTGTFRAVVSVQRIDAAVRSLFLHKLDAAVSRVPVLFKDKKGIRLKPNTVVTEYYRCDALVDSAVAEPLAEELVDVARRFALAAPGERIDYVVSCTSPTHWFVHKIADGLSSAGSPCGHYVFESPDSLPTEIHQTTLAPHANVLVFTDVISSGSLVAMLGHILKERLHVRLAGLIALIDTRTDDEIADQEKRGAEPTQGVYEGQAVILLHKRTEKHPPGKLRPRWFIHGETATPRRLRFLAQSWSEAEEHFMFENLKGCGPLNSYHAVLRRPQALVHSLHQVRALRVGHFQHGHHHSIVFCDVRRAFAHEALREAIESALFEYVLRQHIGLVICPNHSSAYLLRDSFAMRFPVSDSPKKAAPFMSFVTASRTVSVSGDVNYILTTLDPEHGGKAPDLRRHNVLILDDGICTGQTVRSLITRVSRLVYGEVTDALEDKTDAMTATQQEPTIHIACFVSRLPRSRLDFFRQLAMASGRRLVFSTMLSLPVKTYEAEDCPLCATRERVRHFLAALKCRGYERSFYATWIDALSPTEPYEAIPESRSTRSTADICGTPAQDIIATLAAMDRGYVEYVRQKWKNASLEVRIPLAWALLSRARALHLTSDGRRMYMLELLEAADGVSDEYGRIAALRAVMAAELYDHLPMAQITDLGLRVIGLLEGHTLEDGTLGGVAAFLRLAMALRREDDGIIAMSEAWQGRLAAIRDEAADLVTMRRIGLIIHDLRSPDHTLGSIGLAVRHLYDLYMCQRPYHIKTMTTLQKTRSMLGFAREKDPEHVVAPAELLTGLRQAAGLLQDMVEAIDVTGAGEHIALLQQTKEDMHKVRQLSEMLMSDDTPEEDKDSCLARLRDIFRDAHTAWFVASEKDARRPRLIQVLDPYFVDLLDVVQNAVKNCEAVAGEREIEITCDVRAGGADTRVLCDVRLLAEVLSQIMNNIVQCWDKEHAVHVLSTIDKSGRDEMMLRVVNTGTRERPHSPGGLTQARAAIAEYGGELKWGRDGEHWCVEMRLAIGER